MIEIAVAFVAFAALMIVWAFAPSQSTVEQADAVARTARSEALA